MKDEKYETRDGKYVVDWDKVDILVKIALASTGISAIMLVVVLLENVWFDYLPSTKLFITFLITGVFSLFCVRAWLYNNEDDPEVREEYRKVKDDEAGTQ